MDKLTADFIEAIERTSYHNAAEGEMYWRELDASRAAAKRLQKLKAEMLRVHGRARTAEVINATPNLCYFELTLPDEE